MASREAREAQKCGSFMEKDFVFIPQAVNIYTLAYHSWQKIGGEIFSIPFGPSGLRVGRLLHSKGAESSSDELFL